MVASGPRLESRWRGPIRNSRGVRGRSCCSRVNHAVRDSANLPTVVSIARFAVCFGASSIVVNRIGSLPGTKPTSDDSYDRDQPRTQLSAALFYSPFAIVYFSEFTGVNVIDGMHFWDLGNTRALYQCCHFCPAVATRCHKHVVMSPPLFNWEFR